MQPPPNDSAELIQQAVQAALEAFRSEQAVERAGGVFLTLDDICRILGVERHKAGELCREQRIPAIKVGREWRCCPHRFREAREAGFPLPNRRISRKTIPTI